MTARERLSLAVAAALGAGMVLGTPSVRAASLIWDPNAATTPNPSDGPGNWEDANAWYDGVNNVSWTSGADTATFGANVGNTGTAAVTLLGTQTVDGVTFAANSPTYTIGGGNITLGASGLTANQSGRINTPINVTASSTWHVAGSAILDLGDGGASANLTGGVGATITKTGTGTIRINNVNGGFNAPWTINAGTVVVNKAASNTSGQGVAMVTVNNGGTFQVDNITLNNASSHGGVFLNNGGTFKGTGAVLYSRNNFPQMANGDISNPVDVNITAEGATTLFRIASQMRNQIASDVADSFATVHFNGTGAVRLESGGTGNDPVLYSGKVEVTNGKLLLGPRTAGTSTSETLNSPGFKADVVVAGLGSAHNANTVTVGAGGILGGMNNNPKNPTDAANPPPVNATPRFYRANVVLNGGAIATADNGEGTFANPDGGILGARFGGHFTVQPGTSKVLVYDPLATAPTTGRDVALVAGAQGAPTSTASIPQYNQGDTTWGGKLVIDAGGTTGGSFYITRDGGTINVTPGAEIEIGQGGGVRLNGTADILNDGVDRVNVTNNASIAGSIGFQSTVGTKNIGNLAGTGNTTVGAGATLIANHARQGAAIVDGLLVIRNSGAGGQPSGTSSIGTITLGAAGKIDLTNNKLISNNPVGSGSVGGGAYSAGSVSRYVQTASNGGAWDGPGLTTSEGDATAGLTSIGVAFASDVRDFGLGTTLLFGGQTITTTSTLAMYTYAGDANLDGQITGDDYSGIDFAIQDPNNTGGWFNGDFNYDGFVSGDDYSAIDFNILAQGAPFLTGGAASLSGVSAVPEPASLGLIGLGASALIGRRRRRA